MRKFQDKGPAYKSRTKVLRLEIYEVSNVMPVLKNQLSSSKKNTLVSEL